MSKAVKLTFGRHKGRTLDEVMWIDPDYFDYIRSRSDILAAHPALARGYTELGVSGDQTPLHNAMQAMFLDNGLCERLFRRLIHPRDSDAAIRDKLMKDRRKRLLAPFVGRCETIYAARTRRHLLKEKLEASQAIKGLGSVALHPDEGLKERLWRAADACPAMEKRRHYFHYAGDGDALRKRVETELEELQSTVQRLRQELVQMRSKILAARAEADKLTPEQIDVSFRIEDRRFEERNGSDVRLAASLTARVPHSADGRDDVCWRADCFIELKPYVSDDYPQVIRQLEIQKQLAKDFAGRATYIALAGRYGGVGASLLEVRKMFQTHGFWFLLLEDIGAELPKIDYQPASVTDDLPLLRVLGK